MFNRELGADQALETPLSQTDTSKKVELNVEFNEAAATVHEKDYSASKPFRVIEVFQSSFHREL